VAIKEELQQMLDKEVFEPVSEVTKRPITSFVFLKKKLDSEGKFTRIKARLVANGSKQLYDGIAYSPTAMNTSIMLTLKIGGIKGMVIGTIDVKGVYLNAQMDDMVLMKLSGKVLDVLLDMKPEWQDFASNKYMVVKLKKALYRCHQSANYDIYVSRTSCQKWDTRYLITTSVCSTRKLIMV